MLRFLGLPGGEKPKPSINARPKSKEELKAARREAIAKAIHAEERRAEFEVEVEPCCPEHIRTVRYYFDHETLNWKQAYSTTGNTCKNARPFFSLGKFLPSWGGSKSDKPEQNKARPKSKEELEAARQEAIAKAIRREERRAEFEVEVEPCCPKHIRTVRYYFDSETLDWKEAYSTTGNPFYKAWHFSALPDPFSRWESIKGFFKSFWTDEKGEDPKAAPQHETTPERSRRTLYLKKDQVRPIYVAKGAKREWQDQEEEDSCEVDLNTAEMERSWARWLELKRQEDREEEIKKYEMNGTGISRDCPENYENHDAPDPPEEDLLDITKRRRLTTSEEEAAWLADDEESETIETTTSSDCQEKNEDEPFPVAVNSQENLLEDKSLDKIKDKPRNNIQYKFYHSSSNGTDSLWPPETPRSKLAGRPKSIELENIPERNIHDFIQVRVRQHIMRIERILIWLDRSPFDNPVDLKVLKKVRPKAPTTSDYGADFSDHSDRFVSFMGKRCNRERELERKKGNCILLWPEPMSDLIHVVPAYEPESATLKGAFSEPTVNITVSACDMIPGLMAQIVKLARIGRFRFAGRLLEKPREVPEKKLRVYLGGYAGELSEYSDFSFMPKRLKYRQGQRKCNVIIRWMEPRTGVAQIFPAYEPIFTRFKSAFCESKIHETIRVCDMMPGFLAKIVQIARIGKFGGAGRFFDY